MNTNLNLISRKEDADILGIKSATLASWACTRKYTIPYIKIGSRALYKYSDICKFIESRKVNINN